MVINDDHRIQPYYVISKGEAKTRYIIPYSKSEMVGFPTPQKKKVTVNTYPYSPWTEK